MKISKHRMGGTNMIYRTLGRTGAQVSVVGLGCEHLENQPYDVVKSVIDEAIAGGINYMDMFMSNPVIRTDIGKALKGQRDKIMVQAMIGSMWGDGQCFHDRNMKETVRMFEDILTRLETDYLDTAMIFFVDTEEDLDEAMKPGGQFDFAQKLKQQGKARFIGMSSHVASVAARAVESGLLDVLMFPVNPAFDMLTDISNIDNLFSPEEYKQQRGGTLSPDRARLYRACEAQGTAIVTMKTYAAGWLLEKNNMSGMTLTPEQCIHYALSRPSVVSTLIGCRSPEHVQKALKYLTATEKEKDFSCIHEVAQWNLEGACMYCNHCLPCPSNIDVAAVTRAIDLYPEAPEKAAANYHLLSNKASTCIACGACMQECPFHVDIIGNMQKAAAMFESN